MNVRECKEQNCKNVNNAKCEFEFGKNTKFNLNVLWN